MLIACCDDNVEIRKQLETYLKEYFKKCEINFPQFHGFDSGEKMLDSGINPDIAFLDVEMSGISGIHVGDILKEKNPNIIIFIVTAYSEYLDEAMRFHVFRYLSKPIDKERLFRNMKDALVYYNQVCKKVALVTKEETHIRYMSDIIFVEAKERKVYVYTADEVYESLENMHYWIEQLNSGAFIQTHRSYIINLRYVSKYDHGVIYLYDNKYMAYLTRRKYKQFNDAYLLFLESMA